MLFRSQMIELPSGRILANLRRPQQERAVILSFNHAGTSLLEGHYPNHLNLWDLRALKEELQARELDLVDYPALAKPSSDAVESVKLIGVEGWTTPTSMEALTEVPTR